MVSLMLRALNSNGMIATYREGAQKDWRDSGYLGRQHGLAGMASRILKLNLGACASAKMMRKVDCGVPTPASAMPVTFLRPGFVVLLMPWYRKE
jgi:L-asparaginase II